MNTPKQHPPTPTPEPRLVYRADSKLLRWCEDHRHPLPPGKKPLWVIHPLEGWGANRFTLVRANTRREAANLAGVQICRS